MDQSLYSLVCGFLLLGGVSVIHGHGNHGHAKTPSDGKDNTAFQNKDIVRDADHIKEHLSEHINQKDINKMSPEELQFQFFVTHDLDKDGQLDGLEIYKSLEHAIDHMPDADDLRKNSTAATIRVMEMTDDVLFRQDLNFDGTLDYMEFMIGHQQAQFDPHTQGQGHPQGQPHGQHQGQQPSHGHAQPTVHGRTKQEM